MRWPDVVMRLVRVPVACLASLLLASLEVDIVQGSDPEAKAVLDSFEQYFVPFQRSTFTAKVVGFQEGRPLPGGGPFYEGSFQVWVDGQRWKQIQSVSIRRVLNDKLTTHRDSGERVYPARGSITVGLDDSGRPDGVAAFLDELPAERRSIIGLERFSFPVNSRIQFNDLPLAGILRESILDVGKERLGNVEAVVLKASGDWGNNTVWLDPQRAYLPIRVIQVKRPDHLLARGTKLAALTPHGVKEGSRLSEVRQQITTTRVEEIQGRPVVTGIELTIRQMFDKVKSDVERYEITLSDIQLNADFPTDPIVVTTKIPNGTPVTVQDRQPIQYVWQEGQIVKGVNDASVANLEGNQFQSSGAGWLRWLPIVAISTVIVVILALAVYMFIRRYRATSAS